MTIDATTLWAITGLVALVSGVAFTTLSFSLDKVRGSGYFATFAFLYAIGVCLSSITSISSLSAWSSLSDIFLISSFTAVYLAIRQLNDERSTPWLMVGAIWILTISLIYYASITAQDTTLRGTVFSLYILLVSVMSGYHVLKQDNWRSRGQISLLVLLGYTAIFMLIRIVAHYTYDMPDGGEGQNQWLIAAGLIILINLIWLMFSIFLINAERLQYEINANGFRDTLTGLLNQKGIEETAEKVIKRNMRTQTPVTLLMIDIDFFRDMNEAYGYLPANDILQEVGQLISGSLRSEDYASRYQADVFIVMLEGVKGDDVLLPAQRIINTLAEGDLDIEGSMVPCTVSIGISISTGDHDFYDLMQLSYEALQEVKSAGGNGIKVGGSRA